MRKVTKIPKLESKENSKLKVAAYVRVSTNEADQLLSLEAQTSHYERHIKSNSDWELAGIYSDEGISGTSKEKRSGLLKLIKDCEERKIDLVVTKSISRLARNTIDCLEVVRHLTDLGVYLFFESENINTQSMDGELMLTILSGIAESESVSISENTKWSIQKQFKKGTYKITSAPYGYDYVDGELLVNTEQAETVKRIFKEALLGLGTEKIASGLNADGIPTKKNSRWTGTTVRGILRNEKYTGDALLQKTYTDENFKRHINYGEFDQYYVKGNHDPIISHRDFDSVQEELAKRAEEKGIKSGSGKYQNRYAFSGKIKCSKCGSTFRRRTHGSKEKKYIAWCCQKHLKKASLCSMRFIRDEDIKYAFIVMLNKLTFAQNDVLKPLLQALKEESLAEYTVQIKEIEASLEENSKRKQTLVKLMAQGYLEPFLYNQELNELTGEEESLKGKKDAYTRMINGSVSATKGLEKLLKFAQKGELSSSFEKELFDEHVDEIVALSQTLISFRLKCGLNLKERLPYRKRGQQTPSGNGVLTCVFTINNVDQIHSDPFTHAESVYSLIESEEIKNGDS